MHLSFLHVFSWLEISFRSWRNKFYIVVKNENREPQVFSHLRSMVRVCRGFAGTSVIRLAGRMDLINFTGLLSVPLYSSSSELCPQKTTPHQKDTLLGRGDLVSILGSGITEELHSLQKSSQGPLRRKWGGGVPLPNVTYF